MITLRPQTPAVVAQALAETMAPIRLVGGGSQQHRLAPAEHAVQLSLAQLQAIERLDAADQTCTVQAGVPRVELDHALDAVGLEIGCLGTGTIGGLCALDLLGPAALHGPAPRSLVLGMEAVLADGTVFHSGAKVVKNVAGFDLHKLFVGSRGKLFVATRLHLRLRPKPRAECWFVAPDLDCQTAIARFVSLRNLPVGPAVLQLRREANGACAIRGRMTGRAQFLRTFLQEHALREAPALSELHLAARGDGEVVAAKLAPSQMQALQEQLPEGAEWLWYGGGHCEIALPTAAESARVPTWCMALGQQAMVIAGPPQRVGTATALPPRTQQLSADLHRALDPHGKFV